MYKIKISNNLIVIDRVEIGINNPFKIVFLAQKEQRLLKESGVSKIRFSVDDQILSFSELEQWAKEEWKEIPKCSYCFNILNEDVFQNTLCNDFFCSDKCSEQDYINKTNILNDEEEVEFR
jgi:hypothetical protein